MKKRVREGRYIRSGKYTGFVEYRYGPGNEDKIYRPGKSRTPKIFEGQKEQAMVDKIKAIMRNWQSSRFETEGAVRAGLRSEMCLSGLSWPLSDYESGRIIAKAVQELGYLRPTWAQGQRDYVETVERCVHCDRALDSEQLAHSDRFCSTECARVFLDKRNDKWVRDSTLTNQAARKLIANGRQDLTECEHCRKTFRPRGHSNDPKYCSFRCAGAAKRLFSDRVCENTGCGKAFYPRESSHRFCSTECSREQKKSLPASRRECILCGSPFEAKSKTAAYCSHACALKFHHLRAGRRVPKTMTTVAFDFFVTMPVNATRPFWLTPERFDELLAA